MMNHVGRYEFHDENYGKHGSHKFWEIVWNPTKDCFAAYWGRIGAHPQVKHEMSGHDALKKISEKISKGYQYVGEATSALERDPEVHCHGTITADGIGYEDFSPAKAERLKMQAAAKKRVDRKREDRKTQDWFMDELKKIGG